jgi:8-hydroxy-5-deazaflavin:NADPH oxidoreductase
MTSISIIGSGNMAAAIGTRAAANGHAVEIIGRDAARSRALAGRIGHGTTVGAWGEAPAGEIVVLAVLVASALDVVTTFGDALAGTTIVDITNPFNADGTGVETTPGHSVAQQIAAVAPSDAHVVKAFNTIFGGVLAEARTLDMLFAGDDADGKVAAFVASLGFRPVPVGGLEMAHALEWAGILLVGAARSGAGFDVALGVGAPTD